MSPHASRKPPSHRLRPARADDYSAFSELFVELATGDPTPARDTWERDFVSDTIVADSSGGLLGYVFFQAYAALGFVRNLVVHPCHRGLGLGAILLDAARERLRARGLRRWALNVKPDNHAAIALYRRAGLSATHDAQVLRADWSIRERLPREPTEVRALPLDPAEAASIERALGLFEGELSGPAARRNHHAVVLTSREDATHVLGTAVFAPAFPGIRPLRVERPTLAAPLLDALAPLRDPAKPWVQLVIEDDARLASSLKSAGAIKHLDVVHYAGDV
jgi:GNAT superfamily N-acetyltransferase